MLKSGTLSKFVLILATSVAALGLGPLSASAVGFLISATPSIGQQLSTAPHEVSLEFSVPSIPASFSGNVIKVTNSSGVAVENGVAKTSNSTLSVALRDGLAADRYQVAYRYVCDDGHVLVSAYSFSIVALADVPVQQPKATPRVSSTPSIPSATPNVSVPKVSPTQPAESTATPETEAKVSEDSAATETLKSSSDVFGVLQIGAISALIALAAITIAVWTRRRKKL